MVLSLCCVMKFIHLTKKNKIEKNNLWNSQESTSHLIWKEKSLLLFFFLRGKKLNSVLYIRCFKYLLCNYSSNRERETDLLSLKFTICLYKTCVRCSISEMKNDTHQEKRYRITDRFTIQSKIEVIEKREIHSSS